MKAAQKVSVGFISLGCAKNLVDSEVIADSLGSAGFTLAAAPEKADIIIVNTCAFIHDAREESIDAILDACELKKKGRCKAVMVAGCLPQRYKHDLIRALPEVDAFIGLDEIEQAGKVAVRVAGGERGIAEISGTAHAVIEPPSARMLFTGAPYAYVKVSEGCDHQCSFCVIPQIRGRYRSRPIKKIVAEAEDLLSRGILELNLVSQDVTSYGRDLGGKENLPKLLRALGGIGGHFWIRLLYGYPWHVTDELLDTIGNVSQVCHYLDLPVQHSHTVIRKAMGRKGTEIGVRRLFNRIRTVLHGITLRTTCLVGFPGETEEHFRNLLAFIKELRFDHVGVFTFSREEDTSAAMLSNPVSARVAEKRRARLLLAQQEVVEQKARVRIGRSEDVFIERRAGKKRNEWIGRSKGQAPEVDGVVFLRAQSQTNVAGTFVRARYVGSKVYDMQAVQIC